MVAIPPSPRATIVVIYTTTQFEYSDEEEHDDEEELQETVTDVDFVDCVELQPEESFNGAPKDQAEPLQVKKTSALVLFLSVMNVTIEEVFDALLEDDINSNDNSNPKIVDGSSSDLNLSFGNPLYLLPNDTSGTLIVTIKLTGTENYKMWSISMTFALRNHNKLGFIDGSCKKDSSNHCLANQWDMCNSVVVTWILNSLSPELFASAIYAKTASEIWNDLKETYDNVDGSAMFNLHKNINSLNQNGSPFADYHNKLNSLWKQFDAMK
ncbi:ribonuclease H-like domain-containing protein [Tanacetum coccineum]